VFYSRIEGERKAQSRVKRVKAAETDRSKASAARDRLNEANKRRKSVQDSLKTLEEKNKENDRRTSPPFKDKIGQAGLSLSLNQFYMISLVLGWSQAWWVLLPMEAPSLPAGIAIIFGAGVPRWIIGYSAQSPLQSVPFRISKRA
jgi:tight adherence protein B